MTLSTAVVNKLVLARHLFRIVESNLRSHRDVALFAVANLMQDAVEAFLLAVSEAIDAGIEPRSDFDKYVVKIEQKSGQVLPFRQRLFALNRIRVGAKHHGVKPNRQEMEKLATVCREFFGTTTQTFFGREFWSVSLVDLLPDNDAMKPLLLGAQEAFDSGDFLTCLIECRKALYLSFEVGYDIRPWKDGEPKGGGLLGGLFGPISKAPFYTQNKTWIDEHVRTPFDFIQLDHANLDRELLRKGVGPEVFWNIWRLTPAVYRMPDGLWLWHQELGKTNDPSEDAAAFVLENTIDIALRLDEQRREVRNTPAGNFAVTLKRDGVNVYQKADRHSPVINVTEPGLRELGVSASTPGVDGTGTYWSILHVVREEDPAKSRYYFGYIDNDDVDWGEDKGK